MHDNDWVLRYAQDGMKSARANRAAGAAVGGRFLNGARVSRNSRVLNGPKGKSRWLKPKQGESTAMKHKPAGMSSEGLPGKAVSRKGRLWKSPVVRLRGLAEAKVTMAGKMKSTGWAGGVLLGGAHLAGRRFGRHLPPSKRVLRFCMPVSNCRQGAVIASGADVPRPRY